MPQDSTRCSTWPSTVSAACCAVSRPRSAEALLLALAARSGGIRRCSRRRPHHARPGFRRRRWRRGVEHRRGVFTMLRVGLCLCVPVATFHATFPWLQIEILRSTRGVVHAIAHAGAFATAATAATTAPAATARATWLARCARRTLGATGRCLHCGCGRLTGIHWNRIFHRWPRRWRRLLATRALLAGCFTFRSRTAFAIARPRTVTIALGAVTRGVALTIPLGIAGTVCGRALTTTTATTTGAVIAPAFAAVPAATIATIVLAPAALRSAAAITGRALRPCSLRRRFGHGGFRRAFAEQGDPQPAEESQPRRRRHHDGYHRGWRRRRRCRVAGEDGRNCRHRSRRTLGLQGRHIRRLWRGRHLVRSLVVLRCGGFIAAHATDLVIRSLDVRVRHQDQVDAALFLDGAQRGALLVHQVGADIDRHVDDLPG